jgi:DNA replication protein DnaD
MASEKQKFKKKKLRERAVALKMLRRREAIRKARKEEAAKEAALENEYFERRGDPTLSEEDRNSMLEKLTGKAVKKLTPEEVSQRDAVIISRLKSNIAYLEELEKQYMAEKEARETANKILETEGAVTMEEKIALMSKMQQEKMKDKPVEIIVP